MKYTLMHMTFASLQMKEGEKMRKQAHNYLSNAQMVIILYNDDHGYYKNLIIDGDRALHASSVAVVKFDVSVTWKFLPMFLLFWRKTEENNKKLLFFEIFKQQQQISK